MKTTNIKYNYPNGYAYGHTEETVAIINNRNRGRGRIKERFDVFFKRWKNDTCS